MLFVYSIVALFIIYCCKKQRAMSDDEIDPEIESRLYSLIHHQPLAELVDASFDHKICASNPKNRPHFYQTCLSNEFDSEKHESPKSLSHDHLPCTFLTSATKKAPRKSKWYGPLSSSSEDSIASVGRASSSASVQILSDTDSPACSESSFITPLQDENNVTSNLEALETSTSCSNHTNCSASLPGNVMEIMSVEEIQSQLPSDPDLWKICSEDLWAETLSSSSRGRYYARKMRCKRCHEEGHRVSECPKKSVKICFVCGVRGHLGFYCPEKCCVLCFRIKHSAEDCRLKRYIFDRMHCSRCLNIGHTATDCHELWRQYHATTGPDIEFRRFKKSKPKLNKRHKWCYNCASNGHLGHECLRSTNFNGRLIAFRPSVRKYDTANQLLKLQHSVLNDLETHSDAAFNRIADTRVIKNKFKPQLIKNPKFDRHKVELSYFDSSSNARQERKGKRKNKSKMEENAIDRDVNPFDRIKREKADKNAKKKLTRKIDRKFNRSTSDRNSIGLVEKFNRRSKKLRKMVNKRANVNSQSGESTRTRKTSNDAGDSVVFINCKRAKRGSFNTNYSNKNQFTWDRDCQAELRGAESSGGWFC